ncbi:AzlC family ABC transporter permease [Paenibacillus sp. JX-17]|uniref:AzlC family ABC transporter permease n=1 Tax=Paenibacillus lacisoli TaxID=3064525 RepID=A0ABT9CDR7_9BACL|nr:AzlC family ABC transporter permease [Paenibacillus sp. JX-17]MDO7907387.1 AzlC family ABC transporter permease [Paenibacillus sp. JX-17]
MNVSGSAYPPAEWEHSPFRQGIRDCLPTILGYWSIGLAAGVVSRTAGLSPAEIGLMSLILYAGSAQFIVAGLVAASAPPAAIIATVFLVNARHLLMSAALAPYFKHLSGWKNAALGVLLTDETFGVASSRLAGRTLASGRWMFGLNLAAYLNWFIANLTGALLGNWITQPERFGLDFALVAMFLGLLVLQLAERSAYLRDLPVAAAAVLAVTASVLVMPQSVGIFAAIVAAACVGVWLERWTSA